MEELKELEARIRKLPRNEFAELRDWLLELDQERWDEQIKSDYQAGKFDKLIAKARKEWSQGKAREL